MNSTIATEAQTLPATLSLVSGNVPYDTGQASVPSHIHLWVFAEWSPHILTSIYGPCCKQYICVHHAQAHLILK